MQEPWFDPWVRKIPWRRTWEPTRVLLPGESHGQSSLAGCSSQGRTQSDMTEATKQQLHVGRYSGSKGSKQAFTGGLLCHIQHLPWKDMSGIACWLPQKDETWSTAEVVRQSRPTSCPQILENSDYCLNPLSFYSLLCSILWHTATADIIVTPCHITPCSTTYVGFYSSFIEYLIKLNPDTKEPLQETVTS